MKISVVILAKNEEKNILDCLESVTNFDEVVIIDDYSSDRTLEVVRGLKNSNIRIFQHKLDNDFSKQRNFGLSKASGDWVFFLDCDERVSSKLVDEIRLKTSEQGLNINGYFLRRTDVMWGRQLKHGETGNIKLLRLAKKEAGVWRGKVHEVWNIKGKVGILDNALMHYPHPTVFEFLKEIDFYSTLRASELHDLHKRVSLLQIIMYPKAKFFVNYFLKLGFLDGIPGFIVAIMMSLHSFLVRSKLWLLQKS